MRVFFVMTRSVAQISQHDLDVRDKPGTLTTGRDVHFGGPYQTTRIFKISNFDYYVYSYETIVDFSLLVESIYSMTYIYRVRHFMLGETSHSV